jgi:hypothetical protein
MCISSNIEYHRGRLGSIIHYLGEDVPLMKWMRFKGSAGGLIKRRPPHSNRGTNDSLVLHIYLWKVLFMPHCVMSLSLSLSLSPPLFSLYLYLSIFWGLPSTCHSLLMQMNHMSVAYCNMLNLLSLGMFSRMYENIQDEFSLFTGVYWQNKWLMPFVDKLCKIYS